MTNNLIIDAAKQIILKLKENGHTAYFVGGYVRDLLLNCPSSDIDIVSSASPKEIQKLFEKTIPVGIQFGIIIVVHLGFSFEIAQFREDQNYKDGRHPEGVIACDEKTDAQRRDFTINGLFLDPLTHEIKDYVDGVKDIQSKTLKAIGVPHKRFEEDRLRMLRACRYLATYNLHLEETTHQAILDMAPFVNVGLSIERIYQELFKMHEKNALAKGLNWMFSLNLLKPLFPMLEKKDNSWLYQKITELGKIQNPCPLIFHLAYLFDVKDKKELETLVKFFKASNTELHLGATFLKYMEATDWTNLQTAELFTFNFYPALLEFKALDEKHPSQFYHQIYEQQKTLEPVIRLLLEKKMVIQADDLISHNIPKGPLIKQGLELGMSLFADNPSLSKLEVLKKVLKDLNSYN
jgi:poly(A) polymerase